MPWERARSWRRSSLSPHAKWFGGLCSPISSGHPNQVQYTTSGSRNGCCIKVAPTGRSFDIVGILPPPPRPHISHRFKFSPCASPEQRPYLGHWNEHGEPPTEDFEVSYMTIPAISKRSSYWSSDVQAAGPPVVMRRYIRAQTPGIPAAGSPRYIRAQTPGPTGLCQPGYLPYIGSTRHPAWNNNTAQLNM